MDKLRDVLLAIAAVFFFCVPASCDSGAAEECDALLHRRCRQNLLTDLDQPRQASARELETRCRSLEENVNCVVLQVTRCTTPSRSGDVLRRGWKHLQEHCEPFGGWWSYDCFHLEEMRKCEKIFALKDSKTSEASCREYDRFRHCIGDVVRKRCDPDDVHSMGNYLLDSAGDLVWECPPQAPLASPAADRGFVGALSLHAPVPAVQRKTGIEAQESHLRSVYSSALTGEGPYVTGCNARATEEMRGCLDRHQLERDRALGQKDDEDRLRRECCATWNYRRCLQRAVRIHCYDTREVDVQSAVDVIPHDRGFLCRNHWIYTCSAAGLPSLQRGLALLAIAICAVFWARRF